MAQAQGWIGKSLLSTDERLNLRPWTFLRVLYDMLRKVHVLHLLGRVRILHRGSQHAALVLLV